MGHPKSQSELDYDFLEAQECADDKFIWTYTSQVFPVAQVRWFQHVYASILTILLFVVSPIEFKLNSQIIFRELEWLNSVQDTTFSARATYRITILTGLAILALEKRISLEFFYIVVYSNMELRRVVLSFVSTHRDI